MPGALTEITEIATALGMLVPSLDHAVAHRPPRLRNVDDDVWSRFCTAFDDGDRATAFTTAFENGRVFLDATDGLRSRPPNRVEWKGPDRQPGDDAIPADLRVDHVYLVSCKYLSRILLNPGPERLFDRLLAGEGRSRAHWFAEIAPAEFEALYAAAVEVTAVPGLPPLVAELTTAQQRALKATLAGPTWPEPLRDPWAELCGAVARRSAERWRAAMTTPRDRLRLLWRLLRIGPATYFVLGTDRASHLRMRVDAAWDWSQSFDLTSFDVAPRNAGQPEVGWRAVVRRRGDAAELAIEGHIEIRWSHGRFLGSPEAKVYLDTPHGEVAGYHALS